MIFGLISILRCPSESHPQLIQMRLQDLFKTTSELVLRQYKQRIETLEENEKSIKEEQEDLAKKAANPDAVEDGNAMDDDGDEDFEDEDAEFERTKKALSKFKDGIADDDDDYDDEDDEEYEYAGGDMNLYDSKLDDLDELNFMKDTIQGLMANQAVGQAMVGAYDTAQLMEVLGQTDALKAREAATVSASEKLAD